MSTDSINTHLTASSLAETIRHYARYTLGNTGKKLEQRALFDAVSLAIRVQLIDGMAKTEEYHSRSGAKRLYYLSMGFLMGRALGNQRQVMNQPVTFRHVRKIMKNRISKRSRDAERFKSAGYFNRVAEH